MSDRDQLGFLSQASLAPFSIAAACPARPASSHSQRTLTVFTYSPALHATSSVAHNARQTRHLQILRAGEASQTATAADSAPTLLRPIHVGCSGTLRAHRARPTRLSGRSSSAITSTFGNVRRIWRITLMAGVNAACAGYK